MLFEMPDGRQLTETMAIEVSPGSNREFSYTNKQSAFYYGYTNGYNDQYFQGLTDYRVKLFNDYYVSVDDELLPRSEARTTVYFHQLVRDYGKITETVTLFDDKTILLIEVKGGRAHTLVPVFPNDGIQLKTEWDEERAVLFITRDDWQRLPDRSGMPRWLGVSLGKEGTYDSGNPGYFPREKSVLGSLSKTAEGGTRIAFAADHSRSTVARLIEETFQNPEFHINKKRGRLEKLLLETYVHSHDEDLNKALAWAKVSIDALIMNQDKSGIFAGLPWFNDYWGRDTFISLPGASLVTGQFEKAREILLDFGSYQLTDDTDSLYGRIPNRIRPDEVIYNTADGTPWFVREAYEYVLYSGDTAFASSIFPVVKRSIDGTITYRLDEHGFLRHDAADTWMDAKIEGTIPWSSRGDRACDIQALWYTQLISGAKMAELVDEESDDIEKWLNFAGRVRQNFTAYFVTPDNSGIYDHLDPDGRPDDQYRPNQIFCLTIPFSDLCAKDSPYAGLNGGLGPINLDRFSERLIYPFGVGSLWKEEVNFHPYHHHPNYHFDASYHNGIIWTWNSGPVVTAFCNAGRTYVPHVLFEALTDQILNRGAVGTIAELVDAAPKPDQAEPELTGTFTQAWSLAEYLRNFYQDFLGVYPLSERYGLRLKPSAVLKYYGTLQFIVRTKSGHIRVLYNIDEGKAHVAASDVAGTLPIVFYDTEYILEPKGVLTLSLPEMVLEQEGANILTKPEVPENVRCLMVKDFLETELRRDWEKRSVR